MCGIAGYVSFDGSPVDQAVLGRMVARLRHRGPDGMGMTAVGSVGLAHQRLAVIDLISGQQPMRSADGSVWITFNGEIYNYIEIRRELVSRGAQFRTNSDTEVIIELYRQFGARGFEKLRGMFAFALYDRSRNAVLLVRDRVGIKPLYYHIDQRYLVFGSELKALLEHPAVPRELDPIAVRDFLTFVYVPGSRCIFRGVRKVPPAGIVTIVNGGLSTESYWEPPFRPDADNGRPEAEWLARVANVLADSVRVHMRSDVPYAALLSGGVDSSIVVALMTLWSSRQVRTYSIGFEDRHFNELPYARRVAEHLGTEHHELLIRPRALSVLPDLVAQFDEPFADESAIACFHIAKAAAEDVKVCLSGDGGDEVFAGYDAYRIAQRLLGLDRFPLAVRSAVVRTVSRMYPRWLPGLGLLRCAGLPREDRYVELMCAFDKDEQRRVLTPDFLRSCGSYDPYSHLREAMISSRGLDPITQMQHVDFRTYLPDDILVKVDRTSMFHSLELRVPFLDHFVIETAAQIPRRLKMRGNVGKYLLRRLAEPLLPKETALRPKHGFAVPLKHWLGTDFGDFAHGVLADRRTVQRGIFNTEALAGLLKDQRRGWRDLTHEVWAALVLELWCREYLDGTNFRDDPRCSRAQRSVAGPP